MMSQPDSQNAPGVSSAVPNTKSQKPDLEQRFKFHCKVSERAKAEYAEVYRQMMEQLSTENLEPFCKILHEGGDNLTIEEKNEYVQSLRKMLQHELENSLERFWVECNVENSLASLELLKEKFEDSKGKDWNLQNKTVDERTLPIRMRFKEVRVRYLEKQLQFQTTQLEPILEANRAYRKRLQQVTKQRIYLMDKMDEKTTEFKQMKGQLLQMQQELLALAQEQGLNAAP